MSFRVKIIKLLVILGSILMLLNYSFENLTYSNSVAKTYANICQYKYIKLEKYKIGIKLSSDFTIKTKSGWITFADKTGTLKGGAYLVGYYSDELHGCGCLPNHSSILSTSVLNTPLGKGVLYNLYRSMPAASGDVSAWNELHAIIPIEKRQLAFDFWVKSSSNKIDKDKKLLLSILNNIKY